MKDYNEIADNVLRRRDEHNAAVTKRNRIAARIGVPTVSLCLAALVGIGLWQSGEVGDPSKTVEDAVVPGIDDVVDPDEIEGSHKCTEAVTKPAIDIITEEIDVPVKETNAQKDECGTEDEIWIEPHWGEKMLYSKYPEFEFSGITYSTAATWIDGEKLDEVLGTSVAVGYDIYEDKSYEIGITVYTIKGIGTEAAVAVGYEGFPGHYAVYTARWYKPETLGDFIDTLSLRENLTLGSIYHTYWEYESYITVEYDTSDAAVIWDMLLSDGSLVNVSDDVSDKEMSFYKESMSVSVNVDILGVKNVSLGVTENGYLTTNILGTRKLFYIGEDKVQEFIGYVEKNFEGVREEYPSTTTTAELYLPDDVVVTAVTQITPPYDPSQGLAVAATAYEPEILIEE